MNSRTRPQRFMRGLCWVGLAFAGFLLYMTYWFYISIDPLIRILPVFVAGGGGLMLGFSCLIYLVKGRVTGMVGPFP